MNDRRDASSTVLLGEGRFVGRVRELRLLGQLLDRCQAGQGQAVAVTAIAGMGKTRFAQQVAAQAAQRGMAVHWGRCLEEAGAPAHWPWRQLIRGQVAAMTEQDSQRLAPAAWLLLAAIAPEVAVRGAAASSTTAPATDDAAHRFAAYDAVAGFWSIVAAQQPCLLVLDDIHRADPGSLKLLEFLAGGISATPLMVLVTCREDEIDAAPGLIDTFAELARSPHFRRLRLAGLSSDETVQYVTAAGALDLRLGEAIHARTEGHPLFLVETVRLLVQDGQIARADADAGYALRGVPDGVRELIAKRLASLRPSTGRALSAAACIGRSFDFNLLVQLEFERSGAALLEEMDEAVEARLIEPLERSARYRFAHILVREGLYERIAPARRVKLHRLIGEILEQQTDADPGPHLAQLAYHFQEGGGDPTKALLYARRAASHAADSLAYDSAAQRFRQALALQAGQHPPDRELRIDLLLQLGRVELAVGSGHCASAAYREAADLARGAGSSAAFAAAAIGFEKACVIAADSGEQAVLLLQEALRAAELDSETRARLEACLCRALLYSDRAAEAAQAHERAVSLARRLDDPACLYAALSSFGSAVFVPALMPAALQGSVEAWRVLEQAGRLAEASPENNAWLLFGLLRAGDTPALERLVEAMLGLARQARSPYHEAIVDCMAMHLALSRGEFDRAEDLAQKAFAAGRRVGAPQAASVYGVQMFCIRREQGRLGEVLPLLEQLLQSQSEGAFWRPGLALLHAELGQTEACRASYQQLNWQGIERLRGDARTQTLLAFVAEVCVYLEDAAGAAQLLELLAPLTGSQFVADLAGPYLGSADRLLGMLAAVCSRWEVAQRHFELALAADERSGGRVWLAHGRQRYALMLMRRNGPGDRAQARDLLRTARQDADAFGMASLRSHVDALAVQLEEDSPAFPCGLTGREVEVLRLAAIGRNNRDIAAVLDISANTVANHMRSILEKTYTANRTEAAAFAQRHGLIGA